MKPVSAFGSDKLAIIRVTALEVLSEPLVLLMTLAALAMTVLAPAFHYHQFGEPTRMARDAGVSAMMVGGAIIGVFAAIKSIRREIESGTAAVCLSHGVGRTGFFLSKFAGVVVSFIVFFLTIGCTSATVVNGAAIGGRLAAKTGLVATLWGPSLALGVAPMVMPLLAAAALNRFCRFRFTLTANLLALAVAVLSLALKPDLPLIIDVFAGLADVALPVLAWIAAAAAFAARFRLNVAGTFAVLAVALQLPFLKGWAVPPAVATFLYLGVLLFDECDIA